MNRAAISVSTMTLAVIIAFAPRAALGQCNASGDGGSCSLATSTSVTAGRVIRMQLSATSTTLTAPTPADFDAGFNMTSGPTVTISANAAWRLYIRSTTPVWTAVTTSPGAPARINKPVGDLRWSTNAGGPFTQLTIIDANLAAGTATAAAVNTLHFRTEYSWLLDTPGDYGLTLVLSLTSP